MPSSFSEKSKNLRINIGYMFGVAPKFLNLTRQRRDREALELISRHRPRGKKLLLTWSVEIVHLHGLLEEYSEIVSVVDQGDFDLDAMERHPDPNERYLIAFARWWYIVARDKIGLEKASLTPLEPYFEMLDLRKVAWPVKKRPPMKVHPNWGQQA